MSTAYPRNRRVIATTLLARGPAGLVYLTLAAAGLVLLPVLRRGLIGPRP